MKIHDIRVRRGKIRDTDDDVCVIERHTRDSGKKQWAVVGFIEPANIRRVADELHDMADELWAEAHSTE